MVYCQDQQQSFVMFVSQTGNIVKSTWNASHSPTISPALLATEAFAYPLTLNIVDMHIGRA